MQGAYIVTINIGLVYNHILQFCGRADNAVFKVLHNLVYEGFFVPECVGVQLCWLTGFIVNAQNTGSSVIDRYLNSKQRRECRDVLHYRNDICELQRRLIDSQQESNVLVLIQKV